jgi:hypothetical protein
MIGKDKSSIPNIDGYEFIAILKDGTQLLTKVYKDKNGLYRFVEFEKCVSWIPITK